MTTALDWKLLELLKTMSIQGGCLVSSADCSEMEIADAQVRGDWYVTDEGMGYVLRLPEWLKKNCRFARGTLIGAAQNPEPGQQG